MHFAFGFCALLVPWLGPVGSIAIAGAACLYNLVWAPAVGWDRAYRRTGEARFSGIGTYPLAVLLLLLTTPPHVAMAAWGVLAAADPAAATAGTRFPRPSIPWNRRESLVGTAAAVVVGAAAAAALLAYAGQPSWRGAVAAGVMGAIAESLPWPIDDNLPVACAAAVAVWTFGG